MIVWNADDADFQTLIKKIRVNLRCSHPPHPRAIKISVPLKKSLPDILL